MRVRGERYTQGVCRGERLAGYSRPEKLLYPLSSHTTLGADMLEILPTWFEPTKTHLNIDYAPLMTSGEQRNNDKLHGAKNSHRGYIQIKSSRLLCEKSNKRHFPNILKAQGESGHRKSIMEITSLGG